MTSLGFENYAEALKIYLSKYREVSCSARLAFPSDPKLTISRPNLHAPKIRIDQQAVAASRAEDLSAAHPEQLTQLEAMLVVNRTQLVQRKG